QLADRHQQGRKKQTADGPPTLRVTIGRAHDEAEQGEVGESARYAEVEEDGEDARHVVELGVCEALQEHVTSRHSLDDPFAQKVTDPGGELVCPLEDVYRLKARPVRGGKEPGSVVERRVVISGH